MDLLETLKQRLHGQQADKPPIRILFPEPNDPRIAEAATRLIETHLAKPVFLSPATTGAFSGEVFSERDDASSWQQRAIEQYALNNASKNVTESQAREALQDPLYLGATLLRLGYTDTGISGSVASTGQVIKAGLRGCGLSAAGSLISSFFLMALPDRFVTFADCAVIPDPDADQLAKIAISSAACHHKLTGETPRVALLSFSTHGSAEHPSTEKVRLATHKARLLAPDLLIDGELQFDTAFDPQVAQRKSPHSTVAGHANVFIFPNLDAGNIGYKIAQRVGGAKAIGPILQGLARPWMDLSRGCSVEDIINVAIIASLLTDC